MSDKPLHQTTAEYYTVVYRVEGGKAQHDGWWQSLQPMFLADEGPITITAISAADEITRLNCIEKVAEDSDNDMWDKVEEIRDLIVHKDPMAWWREHEENQNG